MRVAFFSDIHSNLDALRAVLAHAEDQDVDRRYCLGDVVGYNAYPAECLRLVRERMDGVILGNHDWAVACGEPVGFNPVAKAGVAHSRAALTQEDMKYLGSLKPSLRVRAGSVVMDAHHASPDDPLWEYVFPPDGPDTYARLLNEDPDDAPRFVILGHTHVPMLLDSHSLPEEGIGDFPDSRAQADLAPGRTHRLVLLNPGSVGQPRDGDARAAYAILDTDTLRVTFHRVKYDVDAAARAIREAELPSMLGERLYLGR